MRIILGSQSPRRKGLLEDLGISFEIIVAQADEVIDRDWSVDEIPEKLAYHKAKEVFDETNGDRVIISCDTIVVLDDEVLGKPKDKEDAKKMLRNMQGREHRVITGLCVMTLNKTYLTRDVSYVKFAKMGEKDIEEYVSTGEPMDKAGAYGIQGIGKKYIEGYRGSYTNIVGMPMEKLIEILKEEKVI